MRNTLIKSYFYGSSGRGIGFALFLMGVACGAATTPPVPSFNPTTGFKPAQRDLTEIFLQLAGSLETYGSPLPYLWHVKAEHDRVATKYKQKFGKEAVSYCPPEMTSEAIKQLSENWDYLSPKLGLEDQAKTVGRLITAAIRGPRGTGTMMVKIFNQHQVSVFEAMSTGSKLAGYDALRSQILAQVDGKPNEGASLDDAGPFHSEAIASAHAIQAAIASLFQRIDAGLPAADAAQVKDAIAGILIDTGRMAESELKVGLLDWAIDPSQTKIASSASYSADQETGLTTEERKTLALFLQKDHLDKAELASVGAFYKAAYDRLSERGKDEISRRMWNGMRDRR